MGGGKGGSSTVTVGYHYHMTVHLALCSGQIDELQEIRIGDRSAWVGTMYGSGSAVISQPSLFGGKKGQGGALGYVDVIAGHDGMVPHPSLRAAVAKMLDQDVENTKIPAFKGMTSVLFTCRRKKPVEDFENTPWLTPNPGTLVQETYNKTSWLSDLFRRVYAGHWSQRGFYWSAMNPNFKFPHFKVRRRFRNWYHETADIGDDANPAHIIYESLTNNDWGLGYPAGDINDVNFRNAADVLFNEGFGLSLTWSQQRPIDEFINTILDHIDASLIENRSTGQWELVLVRNDFDPETLITFDESNCIMEDFNRKTLSDTVNEVVVEYTDVLNNGTDTTVAQDLANFVNQGRINSQKFSYLGINNQGLASKVAQRDLQSLSKALSSIKIRTTRDAYNLYPGKPFKQNWSEYGLNGVVYRVTKISLGNIDNNQIVIDAVEDSFGLPSNAYNTEPLSQWVEPVVTPVEVTALKIFPFSYYEIYTTTTSADRLDWAEDTTFSAVVAEQPDENNTSYHLYDIVGDVDLGIHDFTPTLVIAENIDRTQGTVFIDTELSSKLDEAIEGTLAWLNDELIGIVDYDIETNILTFSRAMIDTLPAEHAVGDKLYVYVPSGVGVDQTSRVTGEQVEYLLLSQTDRGSLSEDDATPQIEVLSDRMTKPYPPGNLRVNGELFPEFISGELSLQWSHRDRTQQLAALPSFLDGDIGPEEGVTYNIQIFDEDNIEIIDTSTESNAYFLSENVEGLHTEKTIAPPKGIFTRLTYDNEQSLYFDRVAGSAPAILLPFDEQSLSTGQSINETGSATSNPIAYCQVVSPSLLEGYQSSSFSFNGANNYVTCDGSSINNLDELTIELLVEPKGTLKLGKLVTKGSNIGGDRSKMKFDLSMLADGTIRFTVSDGANADTLITDVPMELDKKHHVIARVRDAYSIVYINGVKTALTRSTTGLNKTDNGPLQIGREHDDAAGADYFEGRISHVAIYDRYLSHEEHSGHFTAFDVNRVGDNHNKLLVETDPYVLLYFPFDDDLSSTIGDDEIGQLGRVNGYFTGSSFNSVGATQNASLVAASIDGKSFRFNGADHYIQGLGTNLSPYGSFTIEIFIQPDKVTGTSVLTGNGDKLFGANSEYGFVLAIVDGTLLLSVSDGNNSFDYVIPTGVVVDEKYHIIVGFDATTVRSCVNGTIHSDTLGEVYDSSVGVFTIGRDYNDGTPQHYYQGYMDRLVFHENLLTENAMLNLFGAASLTVNVSTEKPLLNDSLRVVLSSEKNGQSSWQSYNATFTRDGYGFKYGESYGGH